MTASAYRPLTVLFAGALATIAFDLFGQGISPALGFANLAPVGLANSTIERLFGAPWTPGAELLHYFAGLVAYPLGWLFVARPLWRAVAQRMGWRIGWALASAAYGVGLWVFALFIMAHLVAGLPAFLNFSGIAWVALIGHILFAVVAAWVMETRKIA